MPIVKSCLVRAKEIAGDLMSDKEIVDTFNRTLELQLAAQEKLGVGNLNEQVYKSIMQDVGREKRKALANRLEAQLNIIRRNNNLADVKEFVNGGMKPKEAVLALHHGTTKDLSSGRVSIEYRQHAHDQAYMGGLLGDIAKNRPNIKGLLKNKEFDKSVTREMFEPGSTKNSDAAFLADRLSYYLKLATTDLNKQGAALSDHTGFDGINIHNDAKIVKDKANWAKTLRDSLNLPASFPGADEKYIVSQLDEAYLEIITGRNRIYHKASSSAFLEPPISTQFIFKDADSMINYQQKYGYGSTIAGAFEQLRSHAHDLAVMERFGSNPYRSVSTLLKAMRDEVIAGGGDRHELADLDISKIAPAIDISTGAVNRVNNHTIAYYGRESRALTTMALQGATLLTAMPTDVANMAISSMFRGNGLIKGALQATFKHLDGLTSSERLKAAAMYGEAYRSVIGTLMSSANAQDGRLGFASKYIDAYFKLNGASPWTHSRRAIQAVIVAKQLGQESGNQFHELPEALQRTLNQNGIDKVDWEHLRSLAQDTEHGGKMMYPEGFDTLKELSKAEQDKLELKLRGYVADEVNGGVIEGSGASAYARYMSGVLSGQRGTLAGEVMRNVLQFTSFPLTFQNRILGKYVNNIAGDTIAQKMMNGAPQGGAIMATLMVAGYASWAMHEIVKGNSPPLLTEDNYGEFIKQVLERSGALGYYGSALMDSMFRQQGMSAGPVGDAAGNVAASLGDLVMGKPKAAAGKALDAALNVTPGINLFYLRPAINALFLNSIQEVVHPRYFENQQKNRDKFNQTRLWENTP